jgi:transcription termination factor Rho
VTETHEQTLPAADRPVADASEATAAPTRAPKARPASKGGALTAMLLPELQQVAGGLGIRTTKLRKSELIAAIETARAGSSTTSNANGSAPAAPANGSGRPRRNGRGDGTGPAIDVTASDGGSVATESSRTERSRTESSRTESSRTESAPSGRVTAEDARTEDARTEPAPTEGAHASERPAERSAGERPTERQHGNQNNPNRQGNQPNRQGGQANNSERQRQSGAQANNQNNPDRQNNQSAAQGNTQNAGPGNSQGNQDDDDFEGGRRRGRRYRDRRGRNRERVGGVQGGGGGDAEPTISDDDVLVPVAGIVDALEEKNTWFVRTEGYFASPEDVYVANSYVRKFGLRRGDAVTGAIRQARDGERREKYNPLVRLDTVNGTEADKLKPRVEFTRLTPLYPQERLRLETEPNVLTTRVIDLVMPIGKGQRALIVSPPKAGKTMVLQAIANAIATNNPEVHLMVVLIDERPEEVTDMQRSVKGEVIASTFDRRPQDHITVAELSIERAKRLVEMGHDVVVLLDSITRLGRAYNLGAPASGRILSGGVDSTALYPPKRFLGAARNIENGGSLTILATALVETGSAGDTVIFEEFKGTGNAELKLDRKIADKRVFPAVDVDQSSTRKEEILLSPDELAVTIKLRRVLHALEPQQAIDLLLDRLRKTRTNTEFLMQIAKTTPGSE